MNESSQIPCRVGNNVEIDRRAVFAGPDIVLEDHVRLDAACVIGPGVTIRRGAWVRPGAVVLMDIPPNAIVEGNPAQVVGYRKNRSQNDTAASSLQQMSHDDVSHLDRPTQVDLGVGNSRLFLMRRIVDPRGALTVGEVPAEVPFKPNRYFIVFDVPSKELRGEHAHKKCQQFLICVHGSCRVLLDNGTERCEVTLDRPDMGVYMPAMIWGTQYKYSRDAVLLVFASHSYYADDYLRTYDDFLAELRL